MDVCAQGTLSGRVGAGSAALGSCRVSRAAALGRKRASLCRVPAAAVKPRSRPESDNTLSVAYRASDEPSARLRDFLERLLVTNNGPAMASQPTPLQPIGSSFVQSVGRESHEGIVFQVKVEERPSSSSSEPSNDNGDGNNEDKKEEKGGKGDNYYANVGYAIRTLRDDIPLLFMRELNYDIYRDDVVFKDPRNTFKGMENYKLIFWSLRFHGRIFFKTVYVEIKRLWQIDDNCIRMRWTVHGFPRVPWEAEGTFDGVSEFRLDREGKIYSHAVDNVIFRDPPGERLPLFSLNLTPNPARQQAVPGGWCFGDEDSARLLPYFSWFRLYLAIALLPALLSSPKAPQESGA